MIRGDRLKALRKERKLTQKELAKFVNLTKVSICGYEKGNRTPNVDTLLDLSRFLNVSVDYLLGIDQSVIKENEAGYSYVISKEEHYFILEIRKNLKLYNKLLLNPKRFVEYLINKTK